MTTDLLALLEAGAAAEGDTRNPPSEAIQLSIAISLKRIADTLDGTAAGICVTETTCGGPRS